MISKITVNGIKINLQMRKRYNNKFDKIKY